MASTKTAIEWTDKTWNPTVGCDKVSPGCKHCYAEAITRRFPRGFPNGFDFTLRPERLDEPRKWRKPSMVFVNSMSDLFHERMPHDFLLEVFRVMEECPQHTFQILTKRHGRMAELAPGLPWPDNVWMGVSVENQDYAHRVESKLRACRGAHLSGRHAEDFADLTLASSKPRTAFAAGQTR